MTTFLSHLLDGLLRAAPQGSGGAKPLTGNRGCAGQARASIALRPSQDMTTRPQGRARAAARRGKPMGVGLSSGIQALAQRIGGALPRSGGQCDGGQDAGASGPVVAYGAPEHTRKDRHPLRVWSFRLPVLRISGAANPCVLLHFLPSPS